MVQRLPTHYYSVGVRVYNPLKPRWKLQVLPPLPSGAHAPPCGCCAHAPHSQHLPVTMALTIDPDAEPTPLTLTAGGVGAAALAMRFPRLLLLRDDHDVLGAHRRGRHQRVRIRLLHRDAHRAGDSRPPTCADDDVRSSVPHAHHPRVPTLCQCQCRRSRASSARSSRACCTTRWSRRSSRSSSACAAAATRTRSCRRRQSTPSTASAPRRRGRRLPTISARPCTRASAHMYAGSSPALLAMTCRYLPSKCHPRTKLPC